MQKQDYVNAVAILLDMDTPEFRTQLNKMNVKAIEKIFDGISKNARAFQDLHEKMREVQYNNKMANARKPKKAK